MNKYLSGGDVKQVKRIAKAEVKGHETKMHNFCKGGVTSLEMKRLGRGMAKVENQRRGK